ncbi:hypothetical protein [uncultured Tateyamaria sp.]|uniref:hypothetical protein n=1 Tax=uncultured Tateyamaria sp. TaxID=455651 RepID=UPI0026133662|nr:hypothetical protein [uncultured Tateyamaria sp.]
MARIGPKDTKPELVIRKGLHRIGYRFRLHQRHLPGKPDLVFTKIPRGDLRPWLLLARALRLSLL